MTILRFSRIPLILTASACAITTVAFADTPIIQPGAPGEAAKELDAAEAVKIADTRFTADDVSFMQNMIGHHFQAVQMAALVGERSNFEEVVEIAGRIDAAQSDEIEFMRGWLTERNQEAPDPAVIAQSEHGLHHRFHNMAGMASAEEMAALAAANGPDFDRMFLQLMIAHHEGAIEMVDDLLELPGSAYDPVLFDFTTDIKNDQTAEIEKMNALLTDVSPDSRANLAAGFDDAETAILNLELVSTLKKPSGFFDPNNPAGLPPKKASEEGDDSDQDNEDTEWGSRSPLLSFANTDMAFSGDTMFAGNYHGFNIYKLGENGIPDLYSSVVCPGGQGDVSVVGDILIMSVEQTRGRVDCGLEGIAEDVSEERFRGLRIFDISNLARPVQVGQVQTCRGSHTHSIVSGPGRDGKIIVYNSGTSSVRENEELDGCYGENPGDDRTALFRIDVIEIPVDDPSKSRIIDSPRVFSDKRTGRPAGLWQGGDHGDDTQSTRVTDQCHDITVFPAKKIAAGACSGNGIIFDISNPRKPKRIDDVTDSGFAYWHSATFNNDGSKVIFTDEWGGGSRPRCRASDPKEWGANAIYDINSNKLEYRSYYKLPAPQVEKENCVAHNGSVIPVPGRDIFVQAWYQGGISVIDFTDSSNPVEIAFFDRGPIDDTHLILGGYWSTYWYNGYIYGTEIARGIDVLSLSPSDSLTENEITAAMLANDGDIFNPQQQFSMTWPAEPVVAHAYIDQLSRANALPDGLATRLRSALEKASKQLTANVSDGDLAKSVRALADEIADLDDGPAVSRDGLNDTLKGISARLKS